ncbi:WYL domain-containing protein [Cytophagales bacterium LB-30]|uniref:WYL domain-containing protein n=1 Tax=Shiella aurantiaca TaxID=3058365 RepID=A0ABT8F560_9BACT|nr:WYL domain-containing protein [Shiella aurantiaca]MDN4165595.1 WYL domain-containing protein [Shiella aurantiaca]
MTGIKGNKDLFRFKVIHDCLRGRKENGKLEWDKNELAIACDDFFLETFGEVVDTNPESLRKTDIKNMKVIFNAPIETVKRGRSLLYKYSNRHFTFNDNVFFNSEDLNNFLFAFSSLKSKMKNEQLRDSLLATFEKFNQILSFDSTNNSRVIHFEELPDSETSNPILYVLFDSIKNKQNLTFNYQKRYLSDEDYKVCPYMVREYKYQWYLIALDAKSNRIKTFALDRISNLTFDSSVFIETDIDSLLKRYKHVLGITYKDKEIETIQIKVSKKQFYYFKSNPIHWTQKTVIETTEYVILELRLIINFELKALIMSYLRDLTVILPKSLVSEIQELLSEGNSRYIEVLR